MQFRASKVSPVKAGHFLMPGSLALLFWETIIMNENEISVCEYLEKHFRSQGVGVHFNTIASVYHRSPEFMESISPA